jgi:hypothetical protein
LHRSFEGLPCVLGITQLCDMSQSASSTDANLLCFYLGFQFHRNIETGSVFSYLIHHQLHSAEFSNCEPNTAPRSQGTPRILLKHVQ